MKVAVYISGLNRIGGVESFAINLCNRTGFDLIYSYADIEQLKKLRYNFYNKKYLKKEYDVIILASANWGESPGGLRANKFVQTIHADYEIFEKIHRFVYKKYDKVSHHVAVSNYVASQFEKVTPYKVDKVIYNLTDGEKVLKNRDKSDKIKFITVSRFSKEKGFERIIQLAELMKDEDYVWNIYGDTTTAYAKTVIPRLQQYKQINILGVTNTAKDEICKHDYLVQLSDTEGFCYSIYESLQCLTPVIATDFPSVHEMVVDGQNGYILDMQLSNFCINKIKNIPLIKSFKEKSTEKDWFEFIESILKD